MLVVGAVLPASQPPTGGTLAPGAGTRFELDVVGVAESVEPPPKSGATVTGLEGLEEPGALVVGAGAGVASLEVGPAELEVAEGR